MELKTLREALASVAKEIDRQVEWRRQLKAVGMLTLCAFCLFFLVMAPFEMWQVHSVNQWRPQPARLISVSQQRSEIAPKRLYWRYDLEIRDTGERVVTSDIRPGDLPMSVLVWSSSDRDAARYHVGQNLEIYRAVEGGKVYLERGGFGTMAGISAVAMVLGLQIIAWRMKQRHPASTP